VITITRSPRRDEMRGPRRSGSRRPVRPPSRTVSKTVAVLDVEHCDLFELVNVGERHQRAVERDRNPRSEDRHRSPWRGWIFDFIIVRCIWLPHCAPPWLRCVRHGAWHSFEEDVCRSNESYRPSPPSGGPARLPSMVVNSEMVLGVADLDVLERATSGCAPHDVSSRVSVIACGSRSPLRIASAASASARRVEGRAPARVARAGVRYALRLDIASSVGVRARSGSRRPRPGS